jgi:RNA polymerase subunit RPABC4/transcription elongation factor Spt4
VIAGALLTAPVYMAYYAGRVVWQYVLRKNVVSPWRIAQLEARLGITPPTVGTCRNCGKPLQVGAEFCSYCGATVIEYPRICPKCATVCLPDAQFCPKCRTPLTA